MDDNNKNKDKSQQDAAEQKIADEGRIRTSALKTAINERLRKGLVKKSK